MIVEAADPKTGKTIKMECAAETEDQIRDLLSFDLSEDTLKKRIDAMAISADAKSILFTIAKTTIKVGSTVIRIGRKILDVIVHTITEFPMATTGTVFGAIFGHLVTSTPVIGMLLGPFVAALALAFGFATGLRQDIGNKALEHRIESTFATFEALKAKS